MFRDIYVVSESSGLRWIQAISEIDPQATVQWYNPGGIEVPDVALSVVSHQTSEHLQSSLYAMVKRNPSRVYIDMHMRSMQDLVPGLRARGVEAHPIRRKIHSA